jgi:hypothetical protein
VCVRVCLHVQVSKLRSGVGRMLPLLAATAEGIEMPVPCTTECHVDSGLDGPIGSIVQFKVELQAIYNELRLLCQRNNVRPCAVERRHHLPVVLEGAGSFYKHSVRVSGGASDVRNRFTRSIKLDVEQCSSRTCVLGF